MRRWLWLAPASMIAVSAGGAAAQGARRECVDEYGTDRCDTAVQARTRAKFGVPGAEEIAAAKTPMLRGFFVNGYGGDEPLVTIVRHPGREPETIVTVVLEEGARPIEMRASVPIALWEKLVERAEGFDRALVPLPDQLCMHGWMVTVESVDVKPFKPPAPRRKIESACDNGPAMRFAFDLAEAAIGLLPACNAIGPTRQRNDVTRLAACARLDGDRAAAAQALNAFETGNVGIPWGPESARQLSLAFDDEAEFRWPGEAPVRGNDKAAEAWARHMSVDSITVDRLIGENGDRVRIDATIHPSRNGRPSFELPPVEEMLAPHKPPKPHEPTTARATMVWTRENGFGFRLKSIVVEPFRTAASAASR